MLLLSTSFIRASCCLLFCSYTYTHTHTHTTYCVVLTWIIPSVHLWKNVTGSEDKVKRVLTDHEEVPKQQDGHQDGNHEVIEQRQRPLGHVVKTRPLFLITQTHTKTLTTAGDARAQWHHTSGQAPYWSAGRQPCSPAGTAPPSVYHVYRLRWGACLRCAPPERSAESGLYWGGDTADGRLLHMLPDRRAEEEEEEEGRGVGGGRERRRSCIKLLSQGHCQPQTVSMVTVWSADRTGWFSFYQENHREHFIHTHTHTHTRCELAQYKSRLIDLYTSSLCMDVEVLGCPVPVEFSEIFHILILFLSMWFWSSPYETETADPDPRSWSQTCRQLLQCTHGCNRLLWHWRKQHNSYLKTFTRVLIILWLVCCLSQVRSLL